MKLTQLTGQDERKIMIEYFCRKVADVTCDFGAAEGEFDFGQNGTGIDYNEQNVYCACSSTADFGWNCTSVGQFLLFL